MDIVKMTRELGAAIQQDERYLSFQKAVAANEADKGLNDIMAKIQLIHSSYQQEAASEQPNEQKLKAYDEEFTNYYSQAMANENMQNYEAARKEIDDMMQYITGILALCIRGEDPQTCEPEQHEHDCGGECGECSGCN